MESLEQMRKQLASLRAQKFTAERSSDPSSAHELADDIAKLMQQIALLPPENAEEEAVVIPVIPLTPELMADAAAHEIAMASGEDERP